MSQILLTPAVGALVLPISFLALIDWSLSTHHPSHRGGAYESWEAKGSFRVRVTAYHEVGGNPFLPGAYISYEVAPVGSNEWREFIQFHVNDTIRVPLRSVRLVSDRFGYVLTPSSKYAATVDGGQSWFYWEPVTRGPNDEPLRWYIQDVQIDAGGTGIAHLYRLESGLKEMSCLDLETKDFGRSWLEVK